MTHWRSASDVKCRSFWIEGSATFTMVVSRTTMSCATDRTASAAPLERVTEPVEAAFAPVVAVCALTIYRHRYGVKHGSGRRPAWCCTERCPEAGSRVHLAAVAEVE